MSPDKEPPSIYDAEYYEIERGMVFPSSIPETPIDVDGVSGVRISQIGEGLYRVVDVVRWFVAAEQLAAIESAIEARNKLHGDCSSPPVLVLIE